MSRNPLTEVSPRCVPEMVDIFLLSQFFTLRGEGRGGEGKGGEGRGKERRGREGRGGERKGEEGRGG